MASESRDFPTIMLIDDDEVVNMIHRVLLQQVLPDAQILEFTEGKAALNWLARTEPAQWPNYIFLDLNMPVMNGWQLLDEYIKLPHRSPLYVVTSSIDPREKRKAQEMDCVVDFISKPLTLECLDDMFNLGRSSAH